MCAPAEGRENASFPSPFPVPLALSPSPSRPPYEGCAAVPFSKCCHPCRPLVMWWLWRCSSCAARRPFFCDQTICGSLTLRLENADNSLQSPPLPGPLRGVRTDPGGMVHIFFLALLRQFLSPQSGLFGRFWGAKFLTRLLLHSFRRRRGGKEGTRQAAHLALARPCLVHRRCCLYVFVYVPA